MTEKVRSPILTGAWDCLVEETLPQLITITGPAAIDKLDSLLRRITFNRFQEVLKLIEHIRFFGGRVVFMHSDDYDPDEREETFIYAKETGDLTLGSYCQIDHWVSIPLERHRGWGSVESTLRHELIHLLQDVTRKNDRSNPDLGMLMDRVAWDPVLLPPSVALPLKTTRMTLSLYGNGKLTPSTVGRPVFTIGLLRSSVVLSSGKGAGTVFSIRRQHDLVECPRDPHE